MRKVIRPALVAAAIAGITKSPQFRLSPDTAKLQDASGACAPAETVAKTRTARMHRIIRGRNMHPA